MFFIKFKNISFAIFIFCAFIISCTSTANKIKKNVRQNEWKKHVLNPKYSKGFTILENQKDIKITCRNPADTTKIYSEIVIRKKSKFNYRFCITSTTHAFLFDALNRDANVIGCSGQKYIQDSSLIRTYRKNNTEEIGSDDQLNREKIIMLKPDFLMVYPYDGCDYSAFEKSNLNLFYNSDYLENHPLARTEWIKAVALLCNEIELGLSVFNKIENKYLALVKSAHQNEKLTTKKANVLLGKPINNIWYVPAANSYSVKFIVDAGGKSVFDEIGGNNVKSLSVEKVFMKNESVNFWIFIDAGILPFSYQSLSTENPIYKSMRPYKEKKIYACNSMQVDYFGKGIIEPHVILQDLINILQQNNIENNVYFKSIEK